MGRLVGRVALITGAARGMGEAEARLFAAEGAAVVLGDVLDDRASAVARQIGESAYATHLDVTQEDDWEAAVRVAVSRFGRLDVLVNNAGINEPSMLEDATLAHFMRIMTVNGAGTFLGIRSVVPAMRDAGGGSIVNTSSVLGLEGAPGLGAYSASKFAIRALTKVAALELADHNIRANAICPGGVETPMARQPDFVDLDRSEQYKSIPAHRFAQPGEVAALACYLASDESAYISGTEVVMDGGMTAGQVLPKGNANDG